MAKQKYGNRDAERVFFETSTSPNGSGTGAPYNIAAGSGYKGPHVESGGVIKIVQDISLPATAIGANVDWTTGGVYSGLSNVNRLPVFKYYAQIDPNKELNGRSNFFLTEVHIFWGSVITGNSPPPTDCKLDIAISSSPGTTAAWTISDLLCVASAGHANGGVDGIFQASRILGGQNFGEDYFYLTVSVDGTSAGALTASRIRLVMLGFEF